MPAIAMFAIELACLIIDLFYFRAAILHILFVCILIIVGLFSVLKNCKKALLTFFAIPVVIALSTTGYLIDWRLKHIIGERGAACFSSEICDIPTNYLGYQVKVIYKHSGGVQDMIIINGYNNFFIIYNPSDGSFSRREI
jgi:hypothetical protein